MNEEIWKQIEAWPDYAVSSLGRVKRMTARNSGVAEAVLAMFLIAGYLSVNLCRPGHGRKSVRVHRLVAEAFIPNPLGLPEVNHINAVRADSAIGNLEWVSRRGNRLHAYRVGSLRADGQNNGYSKLTDEAVYAIRSERDSNSVMARRFGVSKATIIDVRSGRTWRHLPLKAA